MGLFLDSLQLIYVSVFIPIPYCSDYNSFEYNLKLGSMMPPALFFFLKIALAIQGLCGSIQILGFFVLFLWRMLLEF